MSDNVKTLVFPENGGVGGNNLEGLLLGSMMNGGGFGGFGGGGVLVSFFLGALLGRNGGLFGGNGYDGNHGCMTSQLSAIQETLNSNHGQTLLMDAIKGNNGAIHELATTINCNQNAVIGAINAVQSAICNIGNQVGMTAMQTINAINSGDANICNMLSSCCCDMKTLVSNLNYEGRLADQAQTAFLGGKIDAQTTLINDKFCAMEMREMQDKLDNERAKNLALTNQLSQEHQNATFAAMLAPVQADINEIKCKQPNTVTVPYSPVYPIPACSAFNMFGLGYGLNGQPWN